MKRPAHDTCDDLFVEPVDDGWGVMAPPTGKGAIVAPPTEAPANDEPETETDLAAFEPERTLACFAWPAPPPGLGAPPAEIAAWADGEAARLEASAADYHRQVASVKGVPWLAGTGHREGADRFAHTARALRLYARDSRARAVTTSTPPSTSTRTPTL